MWIVVLPRPDGEDAIGDEVESTVRVLVEKKGNSLRNIKTLVDGWMDRGMDGEYQQQQ